MAIVADGDDAAYEAFWRERARTELVMHSITCSLAEQPSPRAVRARAREWVTAVLAAAEGVEKRKNKTRRCA
ncbi:hypothetical protein [Streptomyces sp. C10-9-1]|uniref:hypothetical protein n=1 Tax=Streptomyces sp. C10-9-1 TaxID=1859285 RepID=UPI003F49F0CD